MSYDIYLHSVCRVRPDVDDLLATIPMLRESAIQAKLTPPPNPTSLQMPQRHPPKPGFLGLTLEEAQARELLRRLVAVRAQGEILPVAYRSPNITREQAQQIAEQELRRICQQDFPTYHFEPAYLRQEGPRWWVFHTVSKQLSEQLQKEQGVTWGTIGPSWVYVDKVDGHIWPYEEIRALK